MARFILVGYCNAVAGREEEFNDWYWQNHFKDLLSLPGVISGRRFEPAEAQLGPMPIPYQYLGIFEIECDDPKSFFAELAARSASGKMSRSSSVEEGSSLILWQMMAEPI